MTVEATRYVIVEFLGADALLDAETGEPRVGITLADVGGALDMCVTIAEARMMVAQMTMVLVNHDEAFGDG